MIIYYNPTERENGRNTEYPERAAITDPESLREVVQWDHVTAQYTDNRRGNANFLQSDVIALDVDNKGTEDRPTTPEDVARAFPDVEHYIVASRHDGQPKTDKATGKVTSPACPRFHVYFPRNEAVTDAAEERSQKERLIDLFPAFDHAVKDAGRLIYGVENPRVVHHPGGLMIDEFLRAHPPAPASLAVDLKRDSMAAGCMDWGDYIEYDGREDPAPLTDADIISKAHSALNGGKFAALWDNGDISGYPSPSEADAALIGMLAFYTQDETRLADLFRQSALYRVTGKASDYVPRTVRFVLSQSRAQWEPGYRASAESDFKGLERPTESDGGKIGVTTPETVTNQFEGIINDNTPYFIVDTNEDADAMQTAGGSVAVVRPTDADFDLLISYLQGMQYCGPLCLSLRDKEAGRKLRARLDTAKIDYISVNVRGAYKSPAEYAAADLPAFAASTNHAMRRAAAGGKPDNVSDYITSMFASDINHFKQVIPTGFAQLDGILYGGLRAGLYVLAGGSSVGKTSFIWQVADQIAAAGHDTIYFSLEMDKLSLASKSISRITAQRDMSRAVADITIRNWRVSDAVKAWVIQAREAYKQAVEDRLSIVEGNFNCDVEYIKSYVREYIRRNGIRPVCIVDYLQIISPPADGRRNLTDKQATDSNVTELKRLSRDLSVPVVALCSINRVNYENPIDFESLKESGSIEYSSDCVFGIDLYTIYEDDYKSLTQTDKRERIKKSKLENPRKIVFSCLKNRFGQSSFTVNFDYYQSYNLFEERGTFESVQIPPAAVKAKPTTKKTTKKGAGK